MTLYDILGMKAKYSILKSVYVHKKDDIILVEIETNDETFENQVKRNPSRVHDKINRDIMKNIPKILKALDVHKFNYIEVTDYSTFDRHVTYGIFEKMKYSWEKDKEGKYRILY